MKTQEDIFLLLSSLQDVYIDKALIKRLNNSFDLSEAFSNNNKYLYEKIKNEEVEKIELLKEEINKLNINQIKKKMDNLGICFIPLNSSLYPVKLKEIPDPPIGLFCRGNVDILNGFKFVSIVGTRKSTHYGETNTKRIASILAKNSVVIVSGMASGIDACAHKGALETGKTIAVLGNGPEVVFPLSNKNIYEEILVKDSLIVSEYPPGIVGLPWNFPQRNRIISGLSDAVLVIEGDIDSGSLITARFAIKHDKKLFALPGPVDSCVSSGPNALIKSKVAELITSEYDILESVGESVQKNINFKLEEDIAELSNEQKSIMHLLSSVSVQLEDLLNRIDINVNVLSVNLSMLELKGYIEKCQDGGFVRKK